MQPEIDVYEDPMFWRKAVKEDFMNSDGGKNFDAVYFHINKAGQREKKWHVYSERTDMVVFIYLYRRKQIAVPLNDMESRDLEHLINNP
jgi:hypothetical protein